MQLYVVTKTPISFSLPCRRRTLLGCCHLEFKSTNKSKYYLLLDKQLPIHKHLLSRRGADGQKYWSFPAVVSLSIPPFAGEVHTILYHSRGVLLTLILIVPTTTSTIVQYNTMSEAIVPLSFTDFLSLTTRAL